MKFNFIFVAVSRHKIKQSVKSKTKEEAEDVKQKETESIARDRNDDRIARCSRNVRTCMQFTRNFIR